VPYSVHARKAVGYFKEIHRFIDGQNVDIDGNALIFRDALMP
jgi:hypothetical protein